MRALPLCLLAASLALSGCSLLHTKSETKTPVEPVKTQTNTTKTTKPLSNELVQSKSMKMQKTWSANLFVI